MRLLDWADAQTGLRLVVCMQQSQVFSRRDNLCQYFNKLLKEIAPG